LRSINSSVAVEGIVADLNPATCTNSSARSISSSMARTISETRFLINDFAVNSARPWIYAAAVASYGLTMTIRPGLTACLSCLLESSNGTPGLEETCDTIGVLAPIVNLIASLEVAEALEAPLRSSGSPHRRLNFLRCLERPHAIAPRGPQSGMPAPAQNRISLFSMARPAARYLCGRDSVQIHETGRAMDLHALKLRLPPFVDDVRQNDFLLRFRVAPMK